MRASWQGPASRVPRSVRVRLPVAMGVSLCVCVCPPGSQLWSRQVDDDCVSGRVRGGHRLGVSECGEDRTVWQTRQTEPEFQDRGWLSLPIIGNSARATAHGDTLLGARFLLPVLFGTPGAAPQRRQNEAGVPREVRGGGDKLRGVQLGTGTGWFSHPAGAARSRVGVVQVSCCVVVVVAAPLGAEVSAGCVLRPRGRAWARPGGQGRRGGDSL